MTSARRVIASPLGPIVLEADRDGRLSSVRFAATVEPGDTGRVTQSMHGDAHVPDVGRTTRRGLDDAAAQIGEYFGGGRSAFDLDVALRGTAFQRCVWSTLQEIPFGTTVSYGQLAARIGRPGAARAVGHANGRNPIPLVVPCHRVIGSSGDLTGYGGGLDAKRFLLDFESGKRARPVGSQRGARRAACG
jgi:methylated-DNA-[protein]-cysteine S-methyltransferase